MGRAGYMRVVCTIYSLYLGVQKREGWETVSQLVQSIHWSTDRV
jgi:hypothetical protein